MARDGRVHLRLDERQKARWERGAARDGFFFNGEPNISGWLRHLADKATEKSAKSAAKRRNR
jgi:hypothetical protein